jgi:hypothetical protein
VPRISSALDAVVMGALSSDPDARPASGRDLRNQLLEAEPDARHIERIDVAGLVFALMADELATQAKAMGRPSLSGLPIDTFEMEATPLQCLDRLTVPHRQDFEEDEATVVDGAILDDLLAGQDERAPKPMAPDLGPASSPGAPPRLAQDLFGDATRPLGSVPAAASGEARASTPLGPKDFAKTTPRSARATAPMGTLEAPLAPPAKTEQPLDSGSVGLSGGPSASFAAPPPAHSGLLGPILLGLGIGAVVSAVAVYFLLYT